MKSELCLNTARHLVRQIAHPQEQVAVSIVGVLSLGVDQVVGHLQNSNGVSHMRLQTQHVEAQLWGLQQRHA